MKKLTLDMDTLTVESFEAGAQPGTRTVFKAESTNTTPACCYTFGCGDSIHQAC